MKKLLLATILTCGLGISGCGDYLDILPNDKQTTDMYWKSSGDVESILGEGYSLMRNCIPYMINWGELRGGSVVTMSTTSNNGMIQEFKALPSNSGVTWSTFYQVIGMANSVIKYAPGVVSEDDSYSENAMKSHLTEAYFMRGLMYLYLVRNFKEVPLILEPYIDDAMDINVAKSSEEEIIAQIKSDVTTALATGASRVPNEKNWETKGRATKWALQALMAETCLWAGDFDECIEYADMLIDSSDTMRPAFLGTAAQWFEIFYTQDGLGSNESIFEIMFDASISGNSSTYSPTKYLTFNTSTTPTYVFSQTMTERIQEECTNSDEPNRSYWGSVAVSTGKVTVNSTDYPDNALIWRYCGMGTEDQTAVRAGSGNDSDANWIIYRMADVMLMKAEALICLGGISNWTEALAILNQIRTRSNQSELSVSLEEVDEWDMLNLLLNERDMELAAEGKRWYDLLRIAKYNNYQYKENVINDVIIENKDGSSNKWLRSVLSNNYAWYLPIQASEITNNSLLIQNPYYDQTQSE